MNAKQSLRVLVILTVVALGVVIFALRPAAQKETVAGEVLAQDLPRLVDLGADKCVPCKMMAPILEELKTEKAAYFSVQFIDVWKYPELAKPYDIRVIPTQIFFAPDGEELFRHEGFFSREEILGKWTDLGYETGSET
jgi:thioredoxin 1